jgi:hypothetical protein
LISFWRPKFTLANVPQLATLASTVIKHTNIVRVRAPQNYDHHIWLFMLFKSV